MINHIAKGKTVKIKNNELCMVIDMKKISGKYRLTIKDFFGKSETYIYSDIGEIGDELRIMRINSATLRIRWLAKNKTIKDETVQYTLDTGINIYDKNRKYQVINKEMVKEPYELLIKMECGTEKWISAIEISSQ